MYTYGMYTYGMYTYGMYTYGKLWRIFVTNFCDEFLWRILFVTNFFLWRNFFVTNFFCGEFFCDEFFLWRIFFVTNFCDEFFSWRIFLWRIFLWRIFFVTNFFCDEFIFVKNFCDELFRLFLTKCFWRFLLTYNLLTNASFRIGVPLILFFYIKGSGVREGKKPEVRNPDISKFAGLPDRMWCPFEP